ncbi:MAG: helix-turn-helix domain-containing protein, partial [Blastocatellia bacterium]
MIARAESGTRPRLFNKRKYAKLLADSVPTVIRTEAEYDRAIAEIEKLLKKGDRISTEEDHLLDLLSTLVEKYEDENYPIEPSAPHEILQHLMEARGLKQKDIMHLFGSSGRASEAINGLRPISKIQAKALAEFFCVSTDLFL